MNIEGCIQLEINISDCIRMLNNISKSWIIIANQDDYLEYFGGVVDQVLTSLFELFSSFEGTDWFRVQYCWGLFSSVENLFVIKRGFSKNKTIQKVI